MCPRAWARKVLPTPTGPTIATWAWAWRKRRETSSFSRWRSKLTLAVGSQASRCMVGSRRALCARRESPGIAPRHFVAEEEQEPILVRDFLLPSEHEPVRQSVQEG